jgi:hypothetical protein
MRSAVARGRHLRQADPIERRQPVHEMHFHANERSLPGGQATRKDDGDCNYYQAGQVLDLAADDLAGLPDLGLVDRTRRLAAVLS